MIFLQQIFDILQKDYATRSNQDLLILNNYFLQSNEFFRKLSEQKSQLTMLQLFKCLNLEFYDYGSTIFNYGDQGDSFYVILQGQVGIKVPTDFILEFGNYYEIYMYLINRYRDVVRLRDSHSKVVKKMIDIIGIDSLNSYHMNSIDDFYLVISGLLSSNQNSDTSFISSEYLEKSILADQNQSLAKIKKFDGQREQFLNEFLRQIQIQKDQAFKTQKFQISIQLLDQVNRLSPGQSFGELALLTEKPRIATAQALSQHDIQNQSLQDYYFNTEKSDKKIVLAVINKNDYKRFVGDTFMNKIETVIKSIQQYEIFKRISHKKLMDLFYFIEEKEYIRGQYIFEEGQEVDGVYFLTQGELSKIKNTNQQDNNGMNQKLTERQVIQNLLRANSPSRQKKLHFTMAIISGQEILGLDEFITHQDFRKQSLRVHTEKACLMFFKAKDFIERILQPYPGLYQEMIDQYMKRQEFYKGRQDTALSFQTLQQVQKYQSISQHSQSQIQLSQNNKRVLDSQKILDQKEQKAKIYLGKGIVKEESFKMIQKAINQDRVDEISKLQNHLKYRQPKQIKSRDTSPLNNQNLIFNRQLTPNMQGTQFNHLQQQHQISQIKTQLSSLSVKGQINEQNIVRDYSISARHNDRRNDLNSITNLLNFQVDKQMESLRSKSEKKLMINYLQKLNKQKQSQNQQLLNKSSEPSFLQEDTEDQIDRNLQTYDEIDRMRKLDKVRVMQVNQKLNTKKRGPITQIDKVFSKLNLMNEQSRHFDKVQSTKTSNGQNILQFGTNKSRSSFMSKLQSEHSNKAKNYFISIPDYQNQNAVQPKIIPRTSTRQEYVQRQQNAVNIDMETPITKTQFKNNEFYEQYLKQQNFQKYVYKQPRKIDIKINLDQLHSPMIGHNNSDMFQFQIQPTPISNRLSNNNQQSSSVNSFRTFETPKYSQGQVDSFFRSRNSPSPRPTLNKVDKLQVQANQVKQISPTGSKTRQSQSNKNQQVKEGFKLNFQQILRDQSPLNNIQQKSVRNSNIINSSRNRQEISFQNNQQQSQIGSLSGRSSLFMKKSISQKPHYQDNTAFEFALSRRDLSPEDNQRIYEELHTFKKIQDLIPVQNIIPDAKSIKQKKSFIMQRMEYQHKMDVKRISRELDNL
eukprot:403370944